LPARRPWYHPGMSGGAEREGARSGRDAMPSHADRRLVRSIVTLSLSLVLVLALPFATAAQTADPAALQHEIDDLQIQIDAHSRVLADPGVMFMPGTLYGEMTGRFIDGPYVPMTQEEFLNAATDFYAFGGLADQAPNLSLEDFLKRLARYSDQSREGMRQENSRLIRERDDLIYRLEQMGVRQGPTVPAAEDWAGRWRVTRSQLTGHVSSAIGRDYSTTMRIRIGQGGTCTARIDGFDVVICRISGEGGTHMTIESRGGWAGDTLFELDRRGNTVTGTFLSNHPNSGQATGSFNGQKIQ